MRILITGTTGFIGSHLAVHLAHAGHQVVATARRPETLPALSGVDGIRQERLDLGDRHGWADLVQGCDALIHVALGWGDDGPAMLQADTAATVSLLETARRAGVGRFVFTSSTAANGEMTALNRADRAPRPTDLYGATKAASEMFARAYARDGMSVHVVRPGYIFGEPVLEGARSQPDRRFRDIATAIASGNPIDLVRHDGTQFLHVGDLVQVYEHLLGHIAPFSLHYALSSTWRSWAWVAQEAVSLAGHTVPLRLEDRGYGADPFLFDVAGIRDDFGLDFDNADRLREHLRWELQRTPSSR